MKPKIQRTEGGQGGKRGHRGMEHSDYTEIIKHKLRGRRRQQDKAHVKEQTE